MPDVRMHGQTLSEVAAGSINTSEIAAGTVTGAKLSSNLFKVLKVVGHSGAGACTATGSLVGERILACFGAPTAGGALVEAAASFESAVTVNDQIQQSSASNLSTNTYIFVLVAAAS